MDNILLKLKSVSSIMGFEEGALLILVDEAESHQLSIPVTDTWRANYVFV